MRWRRAKHRDPCPCESGKIFKECCFLDGYDWCFDPQGNWQRRFAAPFSAYPIHFAKHRKVRWAAIEEHVFNGMRTLIGHTLIDVEYQGTAEPNSFSTPFENVHTLDCRKICLKLSEGCVQFDWDYKPAISGENILVCEASRVDHQTHSSDSEQSTTQNVSQTNIWREFIGNRIEGVTVFGYSEHPIAARLCFSAGSILIGISEAFDEDSIEFDPCDLTVIRNPDEDHLLSGYIDDFWCNEDD